MRKTWSGKKVFITVSLVLIIICQACMLALAAEPGPGVSILKVDRSDIFQLPKDFRTSNDNFKRKPADGIMPSREGMDKLNISGSSFFSQLEFAKMLTKLPTDQLIIMDLRLESHGYLDGTGVSWYGAYNGANVGKSTEEAEAIERDLLNRTLTGPVEVATLASDKSIASTVEMNVHNALTEGDLAALFGIKYFRVQCADYVKPSDANVDQFLQFYKTLPKDAWLHFHCQAGEGRTTVFMAMTDMLRNASKVSYEDIMKRQYMIGGQDIRTATSSDPWKKEVYAARAQFTKDFYDYVTQNPNLTMSWTEWAQQQNIR